MGELIPIGAAFIAMVGAIGAAIITSRGTQKKVDESAAESGVQHDVTRGALRLIASDMTDLKDVNARIVSRLADINERVQAIEHEERPPPFQ